MANNKKIKTNRENDIKITGKRVLFDRYKQNPCHWHLLLLLLVGSAAAYSYKL